MRNGVVKKVSVGNILPFVTVKNDIELIDEVANVVSHSSNWSKVQGVQYRTYTNSLYEVFTDLKP